MSSKRRRTRDRRFRKPTSVVARSPQNVPDTESFTYYQPTYGSPNAETISPGFEQFATLAYAGNAVVFSLIEKRRSLFSEAAFKFRSLSDKHLYGNQDLALLEVPWPGGNSGELLSRMEQDVSIAGNSYIRNCGNRLERLRPDWVTIVSAIVTDELGHEVREVLGYYYNPMGETDREPDYYPVAEVAHWSPIPDPCANFRGMSWITPVIREINGDVQLAEYREMYFKNSASPNMVVKYQKKMQPEYVKRLQEMMEARHAGPANAYKTLFLDDGADFSVVGNNMTDAGVSVLQAAGETRIAAAAGVPPIVAGFREGLNSTQTGMYEIAIRQFVDITVRPNWRSACAALSKLVNVPSDSQLWFDTSDVSALQQGENAKATTTTQQATTINALIMQGFTPETVIPAVISGDLSGLKQIPGYVSVQVQQAQPTPTPTTTDMPMPAGGNG